MCGWAFDVGAVQAALREDGIDAWLLYDFHGLNPIATDVTGVGRQAGHLATRRWFYLVPAQGEPRGLVHAIERDTLAHLPGRIAQYAGRAALETGLGHLLGDARRVAMEYSPQGAIPYLARVDAGTVEMVRRFGVEVVSSGDLVQRFAAAWDDRAIDSHQAAADALYRVKDRAFTAIGDRVHGHHATTEYEIQQLMVGWFHDEGLVSDSPPNVSADGNAANPHYLPTPSCSGTIHADALVLLDLWGKLDRADAVYADITWVGYTGARVPPRFANAFTAICTARDAAVTLVQDAVAAHRDLRGWEVRSGRIERPGRGGLRRPDSASDGPQPGPDGARQRRQHG